MLAAPILTRLFSPEDFATAAIFTTLLGLITAFSTWRLEWSLPNTRSKREAVHLLLVGIMILTTLTLFSSILLFIFPQNFSFWKGFDKLGGLVLFLPIAFFGTGLKSLFGGWYVKENNLSTVSRSTIIESVSNVVISLLAGLLGYGVIGLVTARVLSAWSGVGTLFRGADLFSHRVTVRRACLVFNRFRREAAWSTLASLINAVSFSLPLLLFSQFYAMKEVGWYSLMFSTAAGPISILSSALGQSFWGQAAFLVRENQIVQLNKLYLRTTKKLVLLSIPVAITCAAAPFYVGTIFGKVEWDGAGNILMAMTPMIIGGFIFSPTEHLVVFSKQSQQVVADLFRLGGTIGAIFLAKTLGWSFFMTVLASSVGSLLGHLMLFFLHIRIHSQYEPSKTILG